MNGVVYREVVDSERYEFLVGWAETNDVPYFLRLVNNMPQVGMPMYFWRKAEYVGVA